jgi:diacylglycerol kinase family enzyme
MANDPSGDSANSVVILFNMTSGYSDQRSTVSRLCDLLTTQGFDVDLNHEPAQVLQRAADLQGRGKLRGVVAAGGDGTVALLANQLPAETPLAILPLGTENLLAKYLWLTADPQQIARTISDGRTVKLDAGLANGKLFTVMASCGFDADVVHRLHRGRRGHIHRVSYTKPILDAIARYRYPAIRIWIDDDPQCITSKWVFVFNVPRYAMNLRIAPQADSMDGQLDLCTFRQGNLGRGLIYLAGVVLGRHRKWKDTRVRRAKRLRIETDGAVPYQLDGDPGGSLPLHIEVLPGRLSVFVPSDWPLPTSRSATSSPNRQGEFSAK